MRLKRLRYRCLARPYCPFGVLTWVAYHVCVRGVRVRHLLLLLENQVTIGAEKQYFVYFRCDKL